MQITKIFLSIVTLFVCFISSAVGAVQMAKAFNSPREAVDALGQAVNTTNRAALTTLFGSEAETLANPDSVQGSRELAEFAAAFNTSNRLVRASDARMILEVGDNAWPFPIPLVNMPDGWRFDTVAGRDEILNRRVGRNELDVLRVMRVYVDAQREYASRDRDGDGVLEYAQKIASSPGRMDGLYWPLELNGEMSPLGPLAAYAQKEGYLQTESVGRASSRADSRDGAPPPSANQGPRPFHGYLFKILTRQGKNAPGGKYDYIINGNMIGGFALLAWPAEYGDSGIMTFMVNQQGRVYQKDLGRDTTKIAQKITAYDPDATWRLSAD